MLLTSKWGTAWLLLLELLFSVIYLSTLKDSLWSEDLGSIRACRGLTSPVANSFNGDALFLLGCGGSSLAVGGEGVGMVVDKSVFVGVFREAVEVHVWDVSVRG